MTTDPSIQLPLIAIGALCVIAMAHAVYSIYRVTVRRQSGNFHLGLLSCIAFLLSAVFSTLLIVWFFFLIIIVLEEAGITAGVYECAKSMLFGGIIGFCIFVLEEISRREFLTELFEDEKDDDFDERDEG